MWCVFNLETYIENRLHTLFVSLSNALLFLCVCLSFASFRFNDDDDVGDGCFCYCPFFDSFPFLFNALCVPTLILKIAYCNKQHLCSPTFCFSEFFVRFRCLPFLSHTHTNTSTSYCGLCASVSVVDRSSAVTTYFIIHTRCTCTHICYNQIVPLKMFNSNRKKEENILLLKIVLP